MYGLGLGLETHGLGLEASGFGLGLSLVTCLRFSLGKKAVV